jgi:hypothetical protein
MLALRATYASAAISPLLDEQIIARGEMDRYTLEGVDEYQSGCGAGQSTTQVLID